MQRNGHEKEKATHVSSVEITHDDIQYDTT